MLNNITNFIRENKYKILAGLSISAAAYFALQYIQDEGEAKLSSFIEAVEQQKIHEVILEGNTLFFRSENSDWFRTFLGDFKAQSIFNLIKDTNIEFSSKQSLISAETKVMAVLCVFSALTFKMVMNQLNKPAVSSIDLKGTIYSNGTHFRDYYGGEDIKEKFKEIIDFIRYPQKYQEMGARIRRGIMFYGPPGTGKTMLARALANESGCQFIKLVASQLQQIYVGVGAKRVRDLFATARKCQSGCIIFVDEIDALGSRANHLRDSHQTTTTINQFLNQMDGFAPNQKIVVVAATNRIDLVDHAILRSGRFDVKIHIPLPNQEQRKGIFRTLIDKKLGGLHEIDKPLIDFIGQVSEGWCGADLETLLNESIYRAIAQEKEKITSNHVIEAYQELHKPR